LYFYNLSASIRFKHFVASLFVLIRLFLALNSLSSVDERLKNKQTSKQTNKHTTKQTNNNMTNEKY